MNETITKEIIKLREVLTQGQIERIIHLENDNLDLRSYYSDKIICIFARIRLNPWYTGEFKDYFEKAKEIAFLSHCGHSPEGIKLQSEIDVYPWNQSDELNYYLELILIYCADLISEGVLKTSLELEYFFDNIEEFILKDLPSYGWEIFKALNDIDDTLYATENIFGEYFEERHFSIIQQAASKNQQAASKNKKTKKKKKNKKYKT